MDEKINEARQLLDKAFRNNEISKRNKMLNTAISMFEQIEKEKLTVNQKDKIKNVRITYAKELLKNLKPTPSVGEDINTYFTLSRLKDPLDSIFKETPQLKIQLENFIESLDRSPEFHQTLKMLQERIKLNK